jgi:hypothetical protein
MARASEIAENLRAVRERIAAACARAGRRPEEVSLVAVSKGVPPADIEAAARLGLSDFGESRYQEALPKIEALRGLKLRWHYLGRLQSNKLRRVLDAFDCVQSFDDAVDLARAEAHLEERGLAREALVQVNLSGETQKGGLPPGEVVRFLEESRGRTRRLRVMGLMGIGPAGPAGDARRAFREFRALFDRARRADPELRVLSMGMSQDFEAAVEEGATLLRIGTAIFGERRAA